MIKVVIADDELHICKLIQALIEWDELGMELTGTASNGIEALALIKSTHPDILITDIRMPGCNGLELIQKARDIHQNLQIVVISGYANFEYAQSALRFGVRDYLLKPINKEELCDTMRKLKSKIEEERKEAAMHADSQENQQKDVKKLRQLLVERLLDVQAPVVRRDAFEEQYHFTTGQGKFAGFSLRIDAGQKESCEEMVDAYKDKMIQIFDSGLKRCCIDWSYYHHHFSIYGIIHCAAADADTVKRTLRDCLNQLNAQKYLFGDVVFTLGLGNFVKEPEELPASLQNAKNAVKERLLKGNGKMIEYEDKKPVLYEKKLLDRYSREIAHVLEVLSLDELGGINERLREEIDGTEGVQGYEVYETVLEAGNLFLVRLNRQDREEVRKQFAMECDSCSNEAQLFAQLQKFEHELFAEHLQNHDLDSARPVRLAKQYIQNHFSEPISLEEVSEQVGLSAAYFSVLFKKETNVGFAKYLMQVRMEQAKILLRETNLSVAEICKKVGYNDLKYFTHTFEKLAGVKPAVFRKLYG